MTEHILQYAIGRIHDGDFHVVATLTASPKNNVLFNRFINDLDQFLNYDYLNYDDFDVLIILDYLEVPREYHNTPITIEALSTILSTQQKEGESHGNS